MPKISQLSTISQLTTSSILPVVDNNETQKVTLQRVVEFVSASLEPSFATDIELLRSASAITSSLNAFASASTLNVATKLSTSSFEAYTASVQTINTSSLLLSSSFNTFTSSYKTDSASFDSRVDNLELINLTPFLSSSTFNTYTSSNNTTNTTQNSRLTSLENNSGSYLLKTETGSFILSSQTSSFITEAETGSFLTSLPNNLISGSSQITDLGFISTSADIADFTFTSQTITNGAITLHATDSDIVLNADGNVYKGSATAGNGLVTDGYLDIIIGDTNIINTGTGHSITDNLGYISSSLNQFTTSYLVDSASIDSRLDALEGYVDVDNYVTTSSFNIYTSSLSGVYSSSIQLTGSFVRNSLTSSMMVGYAGLVATQNSSTNGEFSLVFVASGSNGYLQTYTDNFSNILYNPSANRLRVDYISGSIQATNGVISGSSQISGLGYATTSSVLSIDTSSLVTTSSFNTYTASISTASLVNRLNQIESVSGSWITESETSSFALTANLPVVTPFLSSSTFNTFSASINTFTSSANTSLSNVYTATASLNSKTGSYATTGSNTFIGTETISGSLLLSGSFTYNGTPLQNGFTFAQPTLTRILDNASYTGASAWTTSYTGSGGAIIVTVNTSGWRSSIGTGTAQLLRDGVAVASQTFYFNIANYHTPLPPIVYVSNSETGSHTYSIYYNNILADGGDYATINVLEYGNSAIISPNVISGSGQITNLGFATTSSVVNVNTSSLLLTSSFNTYTASLLGTISSSAQITNLGFATTSSLAVVTPFLSSSVFNTFATSSNTFTASVNTTTASLNTFSSSINTFTSSANTALSNVYIATASLNTFTSSYGTTSASFDSRINSIVNGSGFATTSSFNTFTASVNTFSSSMNTYTASINSTTASLNGKTGSYATTGSNQFNGNQAITGSLTVNSGTIISSSLNANSSSLYLTSGSNLYVQNNGYVEITGSLLVSGSANFNVSALSVDGRGGDEGGEINLAIPVTNTTLQNRVTIDVWQNRYRVFEGSANAKGVFVDLSKAPAGVGGELMWKASGLVNLGIDVTLGDLKARLPSTGNKSLQLSTTSAGVTYSVYGSGIYSQAGTVVGTTINASSPLSITSTPTYLASGYNFGTAGATDTWIIMDTSNTISWRITMILGSGFNNNMISIERLV